MIKVVYAEDHDIIRDSVANTLGNDKDIKIVFKAANGLEVLDYVSEHGVDIALLDISMPKMDGIEVLEALRKDYKHIKVILLSIEYQAATVKQAMNLGVDGYLLKDSTKEEVIKAIHQVYNGAAYICQKVKDVTVEAFRSQNVVSVIRLTSKEKEVLKLICAEKTTKEIAELLGVEKSTVDTHRKNMLHKTGCKNSTGLALFAKDNNFI